jgi:molybdate transport system substrate-binding protein
MELAKKMKRYLSGFVAGCLIGLVGLGTVRSAAAEALHIFSGAGLRQPVALLVQEFQEQTGYRVFVDYGGSGQLLTRIKAVPRADLFIPGALFYIEKLEREGRIRSYRPIVHHTPVIGVNRRQAARINRFEDLAKPGLRLALGDPKAMALGRTALSICEKSGLKAAILKNVTVYGATVKQLALYVSQGAVDAAIIGRADAFQNRDTVAIVPIPKAYFQAETIAAAILQSTANPEAAAKLADFLSSAHAVSVFERFGFLALEN